MVRKEYSAVRNVEVRGFFVSLAQVFLALFLLLSLLIALIVVAALLAHEKGKAKQASPGVIKDEGKGFGKWTYCKSIANTESEAILHTVAFKHRLTPLWYWEKGRPTEKMRHKEFKLANVRGLVVSNFVYSCSKKHKSPRRPSQRFFIDWYD